MTLPLMAESEEELKSLLMKVKESEKVDLKLNIQKTKIMASDTTISWSLIDILKIFQAKNTYHE